MSELNGSQHILVIDDEKMIGDMLDKMLQRFGYHVTVWNTADQAREFYNKHNQEIDLVILDMMMPDITGPEMFTELMAINPDVAVLMSSGYDVGDDALAQLPGKARGFLKKPYRLEALKQAVADALDAPGA